MRIIKFRGWDEDNKKMLNPQDISCSSEYWEWLGKIDVPVMQFTGLKDTNEKEIYEGDIVRIYNYHGTRKTFIGVVEYSEDAYELNVKAKYEDFFVDDWRLNKFLEFIEKIGNMHENPELVKEN